MHVLHPYPSSGVSAFPSAAGARCPNTPISGSALPSPARSRRCVAGDLGAARLAAAVHAGRPSRRQLFFAATLTFRTHWLHSMRLAIAVYSRPRLRPALDAAGFYRLREIEDDLFEKALRLLLAICRASARRFLRFAHDATVARDRAQVCAVLPQGCGA